jgi:starch-binding outer membrane protein, SusD/RagB family
MRFARISDRVRAVAGAMLVALGVAGCGALDTQNPNIVDAGNLDTPAGAATKRLGAIGQFGLAQDGDYNAVPIPGTNIYNDGSDGHILLSGVLSDELVNGGFIPTRTEIDLRQAQPQNSTVDDYYRSLHRARFATEDAAASLAKLSPTPDADTGIPEMYALAGYTYIYFAEDFCSGVPVSHVVDGQIVYGEQLTTTQVLDTAIARFNAALSHPSIAAGDPIHSLATVGLARALLDEGKFAEAAAAAQNIPAGFVYNTEHANSPSALQNSVAAYIEQGRFGSNDGETANGIKWVTESLTDPRVSGDSSVAADNVTVIWKSTNYPSLEAPVPTASYLEAQLILAEADLQAGGSNWLTILNTLRATQSLPGLADPGSPATRVDLFFKERGLWLYLTGHRLGDLRRLVRQYGRNAETVFPSGLYFKSALHYGTGLNLPLPRAETNNPNVQECLNRDA